MATEFVVAYDPRTGKKLDHMVPRSYLERFGLTETPASRARRQGPPRPAPVQEPITPATPALEATTTPEEEASDGSQG